MGSTATVTRPSRTLRTRCIYIPEGKQDWNRPMRPPLLSRLIVLPLRQRTIQRSETASAQRPAPQPRGAAHQQRTCSLVPDTACPVAWETHTSPHTWCCPCHSSPWAPQSSTARGRRCTHTGSVRVQEPTGSSQALHHTCHDSSAPRGTTAALQRTASPSPPAPCLWRSSQRTAFACRAAAGLLTTVCPCCCPHQHPHSCHRSLARR